MSFFSFTNCVLLHTRRKIDVQHKICVMFTRENAVYIHEHKRSHENILLDISVLCNYNVIDTMCIILYAPIEEQIHKKCIGEITGTTTVLVYKADQLF